VEVGVENRQRTAVVVLHLEYADLGVVDRQVGPRGEREPVHAVGDVERTLQHLLELEIGARRLVVELEAPAAVNELLAKLWTPTRAMLVTEAAAQQALIDKTAQPFTLEAWDWRYYTEKVKQAPPGDRLARRPGWPAPVRGRDGRRGGSAPRRVP
jgi:hypothetical protein